MTIHDLVRSEGGQRALGRRLGYSHTHIHRLVHVQARPQFELLARIWTEFGIVLDIREHLTALGPPPEQWRRAA
ncbi:MAG: hypothetical protein NUW01_02665 [Gemmatimonadaceae bacterium]|nr:hypothetical protein [Gemmatimonadaceae bacterium]